MCHVPVIKGPCDNGQSRYISWSMLRMRKLRPGGTLKGNQDCQRPDDPSHFGSIRGSPLGPFGGNIPAKSIRREQSKDSDLKSQGAFWGMDHHPFSGRSFTMDRHMVLFKSAMVLNKPIFAARKTVASGHAPRQSWFAWLSRMIFGR